MPVTVAIVGVGPLGLIACKTLQEDGFEVHGFEKRDWVGGLWKQSYDTSLSVTPNTVFNTSRFRAALSDFPFPDDVDDLPTAKQIHEYLESYCDHFKLRQSIRFNTEVKTFSRKDEKWTLEYVQDGSHHIDYFDKLVISPGSFIIPRSPTIKDIGDFKGAILHSLNFPDPARFSGQNVLLIGLHATSQDLVVELAPHAKKVYIAHKNGVVLVPRYNEDGTTFDQKQNVSLTQVQVFMSRWFPHMWDRLVDSVLVGMSKKAFPNQKKEWKLLPAPSTATTAPLIADAIYPYLENGFAEPVSAVRHITGPNTIELTDGRTLHDIDTIVYTTGYEASITCAPPEHNPYPIRDEAPTLYRGNFPLHEDASVRNSLAFLGQGALAFPGFVQFELVTWAISQIWLGNSHLPSLQMMKKWHRNHMSWRQSAIARSKHDSKMMTVLLRVDDHLPWLDETAGTGFFTHFSWFSWRSWVFWWKDRAFYALCKDGLLSPSIWRLFDMGKRKTWEGAREQVKRDNEFARMRRDLKVREMEKLGSGNGK